MTKKLIVCVGVLVAAQLLSGCYFLRELNWSKDVVPKGENTKATIGLQPSGDEEADYFFMGLAGKGAGFTLGVPTFDSKDVSGQKQKLVEDAELNGLIGENCDLFIPQARRGAVGGSLLWRTEDPVTAAKEQRLVDATLKAKRQAPGEGGGFVGIFITGFWSDDGDGIPEDPASTDDEIECTGESTTSFLMKGTAPIRESGDIAP